MFIETLNNGIKVIGEQIDYVSSATIGCWVKSGSIYERENESGISHFIEHMMFKGTKKRTATDIAYEMDAIGGQINAFTAKECTCYYVKTINDYIDEATDILCDIVCNSVFDTSEMEKEKGVVIEEIGMVEDTPEDLVHDLLAQSFYKDYPLARPILGTKESVTAISRDMIQDYLSRHYVSEGIVVSIVGKFDKDHVLELLNKSLSCIEGKKAESLKTEFEPQKNNIFRKKDTEQTHICLALPGFRMEDDKTYPLIALSNLFGGGMSSRLFQNIREKKGLVYSVYSYASSYSHVGMFGIYAGTNDAQAKQVIELIFKEIEDIKKNSIKEDEFARAKQQMKASYIMGLESTSNRMTALGKALLLQEKIRSIDETIAKIDAVSMQNIIDILPEVFVTDKMCSAGIGKTEFNI